MKNNYAVCSSIIGKVRKNNEDNFYFNNRIRIKDEEINLKQKIKEQDIICIFDGMGGESKGDIASQTAAITLKSYIEDNIEFDFKEYVEIANKELLKKSKNSEIVGTTMAGIYFNKNKIVLANIGDSKILGLKNNKLIQLSVDDNEEQINKKLGINSKGALTQHLGLKEDEYILTPHITEYEKSEFNKIILCSDGLTDMLEISEIESIINNNHINKAQELLINRVLDRGAKDNTTIIIINIHKKMRNIFDMFRR